MASNTMKIGTSHFQRDVDLGQYPIFSLEINRRVKNKEACIIVVVGEAGTSKSYTGIQIARNVDKRFGIHQIVFTYSEYCKELARNKHGLPIVFDEPSYAMGKREWYKQINQALVKTIESQRFMVRPLIIPIINLNLLDKTLRDFLVNFQVHMTKRGKALVYKVRASQGQDKIYRYMMCRLDYPILDAEKCQVELKAKVKNKSTCLDCKHLDKCDTLRAKYERKKRAIQLARYAQDAEQARTREVKDFTDDQLIAMIKPYEDEYLEEEKVNQRVLRAAFKERLGMKISMNKCYLLKSIIEYRLTNTKEKPK